jgi:hypothetical protein
VDRLPAERKRALITAIGEALWGSRWQADMARAVSVHEDTVAAWKRGLKSPRDTVFDTLRAHIVERRTELGILLDELAPSTRRGKTRMITKFLTSVAGRHPESYSPSTADAGDPPFVFGRSGPSTDAALVALPVSGNVISFATSRQPMTAVFAAHLLAPDARASRPAIVFDRNGELLALTRRRREQLGRKVVVIAPGENGPSINLLTTLVRDGEHLERDAADLARLMVKDCHDHAASARSLIAAAIVELYDSGKPRTFVELDSLVEQIYRCFIGDNSPLTLEDLTLLGRARILKAGLLELRKTSLQVSADVAEIAWNSLEWVMVYCQHPIAIQEHSDIDLAAVMAGDADLFVTYDPEELDLLSQWVPILAGAPHILAGRNAIRPVQVIVDHADGVGPITIMQDAFRLGAFHGVQYWLRALSPNELKSAYPNAEAILANAAAVTFFGASPQDMKTSFDLSALGGVHVFLKGSRPAPVTRPVLSPEETRHLGADEIVIIHWNAKDGPLRAYLPNVHKDAAFEGLPVGTRHVAAGVGATV